MPRTTRSSLSSSTCPALRIRAGVRSGHANLAFAAAGGGLPDPTGGPFRQLPTEILHHLFGFLPLPDLGNLSLSSEWMRQTVEAWTGTASCLKRVVVDDDSGGGVDVPEGPATKEAGLESVRGLSERHRKFALLLKKMTCLQNTRDRIRLTFEKFDRVLEKRGCASGPDAAAAAEGGSDDWEATVYTARFASMVHVFTRGWDESEYPALVSALDAKFGLESRLRRFFSCAHRHDVCVSSEMHLRLALRCLTWDFAGADYGHRAVWMTAVLTRLVGRSVSSYATLLFLMFGPACQDGQSHHDVSPGSVWEGHRRVMAELNNHADWDGFVDNTADDFHEGKDMFYPLAQAVCSCMTAVAGWREGMLVEVLDRLFAVPTQWKRENVAGFLLFCSEKLILAYLQRKLDYLDSKDGATLVSRLLVDMIVMSYRFDNEMSADRGIGKIFDVICEYPVPGQPRWLLFEAIWSVLASEVERRELETEEEELMDVLQGFGAHIMKRAYGRAAAASKAAGSAEVIAGAAAGDETLETIEIEVDCRVDDDENEEAMEE